MVIYNRGNTSLTFKSWQDPHKFPRKYLCVFSTDQTTMVAKEQNNSLKGLKFRASFWPLWRYLIVFAFVDKCLDSPSSDKSTLLNWDWPTPDVKLSLPVRMRWRTTAENASNLIKDHERHSLVVVKYIQYCKLVEILTKYFKFNITSRVTAFKKQTNSQERGFKIAFVQKESSTDNFITWYSSLNSITTKMR